MKFNGVKELGGLPSAAKAFQSAGITVLLYDPRSVGASGGEPRNDIDPSQQIFDYSDAITFLSSLSNVSHDQIGLWGISLSASVALSAAAFDKRAKLVIAVCPVAEYHYDAEKMRRMLGLCIKDRESRIKGNKAFYVPMVDNSGLNPAGLDFGFDGERAAEWARNGVELAERHVNRTTVQSYHRIALWQPWATWKHIESTSVLFVVPERDSLCPPVEQLRHYDALSCPKQCYQQEGSGHLDILEGERAQDGLKRQIDFISEVLSQ
jgi:pimeloyl-ACP methyl ester carboxylesterase